VGNVDIVEAIRGTASGMDYSAFTFDEDGCLVVPRLRDSGLACRFEGADTT
jgi:hypothetical protein